MPSLSFCKDFFTVSTSVYYCHPVIVSLRPPVLQRRAGHATPASSATRGAALASPLHQLLLPRALDVSSHPVTLPDIQTSFLNHCPKLHCPSDKLATTSPRCPLSPSSEGPSTQGAEASQNLTTYGKTPKSTAPGTLHNAQYMIGAQ